MKKSLTFLLIALFILIAMYKANIVLLFVLVFVLCTICFSEFDDDLQDTILDKNNDSLMFYNTKIRYFKNIKEDELNVKIFKQCSENIVVLVKEEAEKIVKYINLTYSLNWISPDLNVFFYTDKSTDSKSIKTAAFYSRKQKAIFINTVFLDDFNFSIDSLKALLSHEIVHAIIDFNRGTPYFIYTVPQGKGYLGLLLHEGIAEIISRRFLLTSSFSTNDITSDYNTIVYIINSVELLYPSFISDILKDRMSDITQKLGIKCFERILFFIDYELFSKNSYDTYYLAMSKYAITEYVSRTIPEKKDKLIQLFNNYSGYNFLSIDKILEYLLFIANTY